MGALQAPAGSMVLDGAADDLGEDEFQRVEDLGGAVDEAETIVAVPNDIWAKGEKAAAEKTISRVDL